MSITVKFFASLREQLGTSQLRLDATDLPGLPCTVDELRSALRQRGADWERALDRGAAVRAAVNQKMVNPEDAVFDGAEVAFFPPVTGG